MKRSLMVLPLAVLLPLTACSPKDTADSEPQFAAAESHTAAKETATSETPTPTSSKTEETPAPTTKTVTATVEPEQPAPGTPQAQSMGSCSVDALQQVNTSMSNMSVIDCDGSWAYVGQRNTDWVTWAYWDGQKWKGEPHIGTTSSGMQGPCYDVEGMKARGLSDTMAVHAQACD
ncbi:MAG: hypothetical protein E6689_02665 [Corynebacterium striatum]|uniref:Uncharacterized protein n=1 Tax=Corynebacterium accolens TaxID=38284 RepID=A0A2A4AD70_9CORY|nr:hypothetical protein [Corynebacterium simulans]MCK6161493.1 hypothetical protein [Corynebacterium simulans]MDU3174316.1 hypothetical protein [Corynebacterium striatum]PCC81785.1 hypothetical protein COM45_12195 [Corynebacterium accolens]